MNNKKILLLEDDEGFRSVLRDDFIERGYSVTEAEKLADVPDHVFDFAVIDLRLNGESGLKIIPQLKNKNDKCIIVILTGYGSIATAVEAVKLGACNYLTKPVTIDEIEHAFITDSDQSDGHVKRLSLAKQEHEYIQFVLNQNKGNISQTAKELGLLRQSLQRKLRKNP